MAAPVYATDLTDITLADSGTFTEPTNAILGTLTSPETDYFIQGTGCQSKSCNGTTQSGVGFAIAAQTITSPAAVFVWMFHGAPSSIDTIANGGMQVIIGSASTAYRKYYVLGSAEYQFGGWRCIPVETDTGVVAADATEGSPSASKAYFGLVVKQALAVGKGSPIGLDAIRFGREFRCTNGDVTNGYASFGGSSPDAGAATYDNDNTRRWGQITPQNGAFFQQGLFIMGLAGTAVDFRDSNRVIFIQNTTKVASNFNGFEVRNASSRVDWTGISVQALGTISRGFFLVTDNADVNLDTCTFTDMDTFTFMAATSALNCTFRRTNAVTAPGSNLTGSIFATPTVAANTSALIWNVNTNPNGLLDNTIFSKGTNAHHAIEFGTSSPLTMTLTGIDFTGFSASQNNNASIFHIKRTSGAETVTINLIGCSSDVSFATSYRTDGAVVVIVQDPVTFSVTVKNLETSAVIENARVMVPVTNGTNFPYQASVTITGSGTTATVTHTTHGLADNDNILIAGANQDEYNGAYTIDVTGTNTYTYTTPATVSASPATGTITATMVLLNGLTNASGVIADSRTYSGAQPVSGWVRKATGSPLYRQAPVADTISNSTGLSVTVFLQPDE